MFYNKIEKEYLGKYFKYYRKKNRIKFEEIFDSYICGHTTYSDVESGMVKMMKFMMI